MKKRIAFFGGSFDPVHNAHVRIAEKLPGLFSLDEFFFVPAFHAPHKPDLKPTSAYHRFAMLSLGAENLPRVKVSTIELDMPEKPYTVQTIERIKNEAGDSARIFFVIGADSWRDIKNWRDWEKLLLMANFIVVDRPGIEMDVSHVAPQIQKRVINLRALTETEITARILENEEERIYFTDAVQLDISAVKIREQIEMDEPTWRENVPASVVQYIEKYKLYKDHGTNFERKITSA